MAKAFVFDYDDTLVQTRQCRISAIQALALRHYSYSLAKDCIELHWGKPFDSLFEALFRARDEDIGRVIRRYIDLIDEYPMVAHVGATEALTDLAKDFCVCIVTSASRQVVMPDLVRLGFPVNSIKVIQCAEDTDRHKPDPRVFDPVLSTVGECGIARDEVVYIGDAISDYTAASAAGIDFIGFNGRSEYLNPFESLPIRVISDLRELLVCNN